MREWRRSGERCAAAAVGDEVEAEDEERAEEVVEKDDFVVDAETLALGNRREHGAAKK